MDIDLTITGESFLLEVRIVQALKEELDLRLYKR